jgi:hypothetical protein
MATHAALKKQFSRLCSDKKNDQKEALLLIKNHFIARLDEDINGGQPAGRGRPKP